MTTAMDITAGALDALTEDGSTYDLPECSHCGRTIESDDGTWYHPDTMSARCDGPDDEPGLFMSDMIRQATPRGTLRLRIMPDDPTPGDPFGGADCYGQATYGEGHGHSAYGYEVRPDGFDGNAERLYYGNDGPWWWQPPKDGPKRGTPEFSAFRDSVRELLAPESDADAYGHRPVLAVASLWGIEPFPTSEYVRDVVTDLVAEVLP